MHGSLPAGDGAEVTAELAQLTASKDPLGDFLAHVERRGLELYPAQEEAILALAAGESVILNTPTGSGKSLVALALHAFSYAAGRRSYYTCPIKALVNEKFFALVADFGAENVGLMTGDATVNRDAPIICCTAEIVANMALREGEFAPIDDLVMDEFHYYADRDRGVAWQLPLLTLARANFLLMSATIGDATPFVDALTDLTGKAPRLVKSTDRPVPLHFNYKEAPLHEVVRGLLREGKVPAYVVSFTQREAVEEAQNLTSIDWTTKEEKKALTEALRGVRFTSPFGATVQRFLKQGVGLHHAGLLPKYRRLVERLSGTGLLKIISGTDTLGVGVNIPIRTVVLTKLCKFDGEKTIIVSARDFHQMAGRAGRRGFDHEGDVVVLAPEHVIENARLEAKAGQDPVKKKRIVRKKPPEHGYQHWDNKVFDRLVAAEPEPLVSRFRVTHAMLLAVLSRNEGAMPLARLIRDSHERLVDKRAHGRRALSMLRALIDAGIIERRETRGGGHRLVVNPDLQPDFALDRTLSLYLVEAIRVLDPAEPNYAVKLLSFAEAILEQPDFILRRQVDKLRRDRIGELKASGVPFEEREVELDKIDYPKPEAELIYATFNAFAAHHPWVDGENIHPKGIAREMFEGFFSFSDYVKEYGLERGEGLLLRYLSEIVRVLRHNIPNEASTESFVELRLFFETIVREVDSTLIDEWEALLEGRTAPEAVGAGVDADVAPALDDRALLIMARNFSFAVVRSLARGMTGAAVASLEEASLDGTLTPQFSGTSLEKLLAAFREAEGALRVDDEARRAAAFRIQRGPNEWKIEQILFGPEGPTERSFAFRLHVAETRARGKLVVSPISFGAPMEG